MKIPPDPTLEWFAATSRKLTPEGSSPLPATAENEISLHFDWRPSVIDGRVIFYTTILRAIIQSEIQYEVDLHRLDHEQLQQLHSILSRRHAGTDNSYEITRAIVWLLTISLLQHGTPADQVNAKVRALLLSSQSETPH